MSADTGPTARRPQNASAVAEDPPVPEFDFPPREPRAAATRPEPEAPRHEPAAEPAPEPVAVEPPPPPAGADADRETGFLSPRPARRRLESVFVRVVATAGIVGIATALAAVLGAVDTAGWLIGLVVSLLSVILAALLWRSRVL